MSQSGAFVPVHPAAARPFDGLACMASLDETARSRFEAACRTAVYAAGEKVEMADSVGFVRRGAVRVSLPPDRNGEVVFRDVGEGGVIGDFEALAGAPAQFAAAALTASDVVHMPVPAFLDMLESFPVIALAMLRGHAQEALAAAARKSEGAQGTAVPLYRELLDLAEPDPASPDAMIIARLPRHRELAAWTGLSVEAVADVLADLLRSGCAARRYPGLVILDAGRLRDLAAR